MADPPAMVVVSVRICIVLGADFDGVLYPLWMSEGVQVREVRVSLNGREKLLRRELLVLELTPAPRESLVGARALYPSELPPVLPAHGIAGGKLHNLTIFDVSSWSLEELALRFRREVTDLSPQRFDVLPMRED